MIGAKDFNIKREVEERDRTVAGFIPPTLQATMFKTHSAIFKIN